MKVIYTKKHIIHRPPYEIFDGRAIPHSEKPERIDNILKRLIKQNISLSEVKRPVPQRLLYEIHSKDYLDFLKKTAKLYTGKYIIPSVFDQTIRSDENMLSKLGFYSFDTYTPMANSTYQAAFLSASCSFEAADLLLKTQDSVIYALCRPPGHHAQRSKMGGYCYLNNAAVAAQHLAVNGGIAILDVDFHHGNGTQDIFYERSDVLTISIHADPRYKFPHTSGFESEIGLGRGKGANINYPLKLKTDNKQYQKTLEKALIKITRFKPKYLIVAFGTDTHELDPIGGFSLSTYYYHTMATTIFSLKLPTVIIQEGGYNTSFIGKNVASFLSGFE